MRIILDSNKRLKGNLVTVTTSGNKDLGSMEVQPSHVTEKNGNTMGSTSAIYSLKKTFKSARVEVFYKILIQFGIFTKIITITKCIYETYSKVRIYKIFLCIS